MEYEYAALMADGTTIDFTPPPEGPPAVKLSRYRVFFRECGGRLRSTVSAELFRRLLAGRGFEVEAPSSCSTLTARRS
jgi:hypothetical protein